MNKRMKKKNKKSIGDILGGACCACGMAMRRLGYSVTREKQLRKNKTGRGYYIKNLWED